MWHTHTHTPPCHPVLGGSVNTAVRRRWNNSCLTTDNKGWCAGAESAEWRAEHGARRVESREREVGTANCTADCGGASSVGHQRRGIRQLLFEARRIRTALADDEKDDWAIRTIRTKLGWLECNSTECDVKWCGELRHEESPCSGREPTGRGKLRGSYAVKSSPCWRSVLAVSCRVGAVQCAGSVMKFPRTQQILKWKRVKKACKSQRF